MKQIPFDINKVTDKNVLITTLGLRPVKINSTTTDNRLFPIVGWVINASPIVQPITSLMSWTREGKYSTNGLSELDLIMWIDEDNGFDYAEEVKFKPFDRVLVRENNQDSKWMCGLYSHAGSSCVHTLSDHYSYCIPYNDETKYLLGTALCPPNYIIKVGKCYRKNV